MSFWDEVTVLRLLGAVVQEAQRQEAWWAATRGEAPIVPWVGDPPEPSTHGLEDR